MRALITAIALLAIAPVARAQHVITDDSITRHFGCLAFGSVEDRAHYRVLTLWAEVIDNRSGLWQTAVAETAAKALREIDWPARSYMEHANIMDVEFMLAGELMHASDWHGRGMAPLLTKEPDLYWEWQRAAEEEVDEFISKTESLYLESGLTCVTSSRSTRPVRVEPVPDVEPTPTPPAEAEPEPYEAPTALAIVAMLQDEADDPTKMIEIMTHPEHQRVLKEDHRLKPAMRYVVDKTIEREQQRLGALVAAGDDTPEQYRASAKTLDGVRFLCIKFGLDYRRDELDSGIELFRAKGDESAE